MTYRGIITRSQWGALPAARAVGRATFTAGAGIHYGGPAPSIRTHADCYATVRGYQAFHLRDRGWADIAYSFLPCQHGYAFEGRGWWGRVAAHDDGDARDGNENTLYRAFCWLGGQGQTPTADAVDAFRALIAEGRRLGAGRAVVPHTRLQPGHTLCPGQPLIDLIDSGALEPRPVLTQPTPQAQEIDDMTPAQERKLDAALASAGNAEAHAYETRRILAAFIGLATEPPASDGEVKFAERIASLDLLSDLAAGTVTPAVVDLDALADLIVAKAAARLAS